MKLLIRRTIILSLLATVLVLSCKKELPCPDCNQVNKQPVAKAGADEKIALPKDSVVLDGSASTDRDGKINAWSWTKISGPASFTIANAAVNRTVVKNLTAGIYQFELTVTDNGGLLARDTVQVIVDNPTVNQPPVANAGSDQTINLPANVLTLDGSKSADPDNNVAAYSWTKISGPSVFNIVNPTAAQTQVTSLVQGLYQFELKVTDAGGLFSKDTVQVTVNGVTACGGSRPQVNVSLTPLTTLQAVREGMAVAAVGNKVVFAGGYNTSVSSRIDIYDIATNTWSTNSLSVPRYYMSAIAVGNKVFFAGGRSDTTRPENEVVYYSTVDIIDVATNTKAVGSLSEKMQDIAVAAVGNKVLFAGGWREKLIGGTSYDDAWSNKVDIYDLSANTWSSNTLSEAKQGISAVSLNNKIYLAGGITQNNYSNKIDIYDDATGSWSASTLSTAKADMAGIGVANKIYWAGGTITNSLACEVEIRDVVTQSTSLSYLSNPDVVQGVLKDSKIIFKGSNAGGNTFDIYDYNTNTWSVGVLPANSPKYLRLIPINNTIYAAGYVRDGNGNLTRVDLYKLEF